MKKKVYREMQEIRKKQFEDMFNKVNDIVTLENNIATGKVKVASIKTSGKPKITTKKKVENKWEH